MNNIDPFEIEILLIKYIQKGTTSEETRLVEAWLNESDENRLEFDKVCKAHQLKHLLDSYYAFDPQKGFQTVNKKLERRKSKRIWINTLSRIAAILTLPLLISTLTLGHLLMNSNNYGSEEEIQYVEVNSSHGMITRLELPDHSKVCLNGGSTLRYPAIFKGKTREVELTGEGYFEVNSDKEHPFFVSTTSGIKVMAHGTQFNVNTYDDRDEIEATLVEGKVDIHSFDNFMTNLKPGEKLFYNKKTQEYNVKQVNLYEATAWKDGKIVFRNTTLEEALKILGHKFNVNIIVHNNPSKKQYKFWATFTDETIHQIFGYLESAAPIKWKVNSLKQNNDTTFAKQQIDVWLK